MVILKNLDQFVFKMNNLKHLSLKSKYECLSCDLMTQIGLNCKKLSSLECRLQLKRVLQKRHMTSSYA